MINLTLVIFLCTLINQIVSWVGKSVLQEIVRPPVCLDLATIPGHALHG